MDTCTIAVEGKLTEAFGTTSGGCRMNAAIESVETGKPVGFVATDEAGKVIPSDTGVATPSRKGCAHVELAAPDSHANICVRSQSTGPRR